MTHPSDELSEDPQLRTVDLREAGKDHKRICNGLDVRGQTENL